MPEKVIRISAEDSGFSETVNRMGDNMRQAFRNAGFDDILKEADAKFNSLADKIKFVNQELNRVKEANAGDIEDEIKTIRKRKGQTAEQKENSIDRIRSETNEQNASLDKLAQTVNEFGDKAELNLNSRQRRQGGGAGDGNSGNSGYFEALKDLMRGNVGGAFGRVKRAAGGELIRTLEGMNSTLGRSLLVMGGVIGAAISGAVLLAQKGYEDLRSENKLKSRLNVGENFADSEALATLGMSRSEFRDFATSTSYSRRSSANIENESIRRMGLVRGFGIDQNQIAGFDQFYRGGAGGQNLTDVNENMNAIRTIQTVLVRSEQQGLLGVNKGDFTALPERIAQVQGVMQMQFANNEKVNANSAVNMVMAGQQIGGRFADSRSGEAFGRIDSSIRQPGGPGMRAFIFEMLRRANPGGSYTDIMGQMEGGATPENLQAILPSIAQLPQGEMRRMMLFQFTKNWQDAKRLDQAGNLDNMLKTLKQNPISDKESAQVFGATAERVDKLNTGLDKSLQNISNQLSSIGKDVAKASEWLIKNSTSAAPGPLSPPVISGDTLRTNIITTGSTTGQKTQK